MKTNLLTNLTADVLKDFCCGNSIIDSYFKEQAINDADAVTYCFMEDEKQDIVGLSSLSCSGIIIADHSKRFTYPAVEIKMFAINDNYKHKCLPNEADYHWSDCCFDLTLSLINEITDMHCGASRVILYAVPDSLHFYERNRMQRFTDLMLKDDKRFLEGCTPMFILL